PVRSAGRSASTAPTARRIWRSWRCMPRSLPTAGGDRMPLPVAQPPCVLRDGVLGTPPQDEKRLCVELKTHLILRRSRSDRLEGRIVVGRRLLSVRLRGRVGATGAYKPSAQWPDMAR